MPFVPVTTIGRFGAQPFRGHGYKFGILAGGDFPGVTLETTWSPVVRSALTYVQIGEALDRFIAPNQKEQLAVLASVEVDVVKGLTVKPTYAYASYDGGNCGTSTLGTPAYGGYDPNTNCPVLTPGSLADVRTFIVDTIAGVRAGPFLVESRLMYTPGVAANHDVQNGGGGVIRTYQPINPGFAYMFGWSEIWTTGFVDYASVLYGGRSGLPFVSRRATTCTGVSSGRSPPTTR